MALSFTEGSIGGDIEKVNLTQLASFYGKVQLSEVAQEREPSGSNGIAIAPSNTVGHHALLLINPHTSFFFRSELQMVSGEGLNAYGAATWGQFFIYQGFNERAGWMHTTSGVDAVDEYLEPVKKAGYVTKEIAVPYKTDTGMAEKKFTVYYTDHGPVIRESDGRWVSIRLMKEHVKALMQSYSRTKAHTYKEYRETMELKGNSSNNTIFADADGDIAYFHGNYIPRRDTSFDWTKPVDGSNPATEYKGLLTIDETPHLLNPATGWIYNSNDWPWQAAGASSPKKDDYPAYVESGRESARGRHAVMLLEKKKDYTLESLNAAAYDSYLPGFEKLIPALVKAWEDTPVEKLAEQIKVLRGWDLRWGVDSVATSLAVFYGEELRRKALPTETQMLEALAAASNRLTTDFGSWKTPWGEINRFERITGDIVQPFSDSAASIPVGFTSSAWGSLASFGARPYPGTKKWYGTSGNSFVAVVEFGDKVRAKAVTAGGESGHAGTKHFNDEAQRYSTGQLRDVYFYKSDLKGHIERQYHPGQ
jgi:acyl-homoserine lactone acylase PvdQ